MLPVAPFIRLLCLLCTTLLLGSCSPYLSPRQNSRLVHEIIFSDERLPGMQAEADKGIIRYIDSNLIYRYNLSWDLDLSYEFSDSIKIDGLRLDKVQPMRLTIPPQWQHLYRYYQGDFEAQIRLKKHYMIFTSPLIPTESRGKYIWQRFSYQFDEDDGFIFLFLFVKVDTLTIKRGKIDTITTEFHDVYGPWLVGMSDSQ